MHEEEECFTVSISISSSSSGLTVNPRTATVCINDDDGIYVLAIYSLLWFMNFHILTATPVRIGLQQTMYSVHETDGYQVVCAEIQSGDIAGRTIEISYSTTSGTALGTLLAYEK